MERSISLKSRNGETFSVKWKRSDAPTQEDLDAIREQYDALPRAKQIDLMLTSSRKNDTQKAIPQMQRGKDDTGANFQRKKLETKKPEGRPGIKPAFDLNDPLNTGNDYLARLKGSRQQSENTIADSRGVLGTLAAIPQEGITREGVTALNEQIGKMVPAPIRAAFPMQSKAVELGAQALTQPLDALADVRFLNETDAQTPLDQRLGASLNVALSMAPGISEAALGLAGKALAPVGKKIAKKLATTAAKPTETLINDALKSVMFDTSPSPKASFSDFEARSAGYAPKAGPEGGVINVSAIPEQTGTTLADDLANSVKKIKSETSTPKDPVIATNAPDPTPTVETPKPTTEPKGTSARKADMSDDALEMGLDPTDPAGSRSWAEAMSEADKQGIAKKAATIARSILDKPRPLSDVETAGMVKRATEVKAEWRAAVEAGDHDATNLAEQEFDEIRNALAASGTEKGRALASQKLTLDDDLSFLTVKNRIEAKGGKVNREELLAVTDKLKEAEEKLAEQEAKYKADLADAIAKKQSEGIKVKKPRSAEQIRADIAKRAAERNARLTAEQTGGEVILNAGPRMDPEDLKYLAQQARDYIELGYRSVADIAKAMADDGIKASIEDIADALTMRGEGKTRSELQKAIADLKKEAGRISPARDAEKQLTLRKQIAEYQRQLDEGDYILETAKRAVPSTEVQALRKERDELKRTILTKIQEAGKTRGEKAIEGVRSFGSGMALANPVARAIDVVANTAKGSAFIAESIVRSGVDGLLDKAIYKTGTNVEGMWTGGRLQRVTGATLADIRKELPQVLKGTDADTLAKYGRSNFFQRLAGVTDVPFKAFYEKMATDQLAELAAREHLGKSATKEEVAYMRDRIVENIDKHPSIKEAAHEYALQQTFNVDNFVGKAAQVPSEIASQLARKKMKDPQRRLVKATVGMLSEFTVGRFAKTIGNVALDRANRTILGPAEGVARLAFTKGAPGMAQRKQIADLFAKGMVGIGLTEMGKYAAERKAAGDPAYQWVPIPTKGGSGNRAYLDFGDYAQLGGPFAPFLYGVAQHEAKGNKELLFKTTMNLVTDQPLISNLKTTLQSMEDMGSATKQGARIAANLILPAGLREAAKRQDVKEQTGSYLDTGKAKNRKVEGKQGFVRAFTDQLKAGIPGKRQELPKSD